RGANLKDSDLRNATLTNANLVGANLSNSDLRGTVFFGADLSNANLKGAHILGTKFNGAILCNTTMPDGHVEYMWMPRPADQENAGGFGGRKVIMRQTFARRLRNMLIRERLNPADEPPPPW
ncbi:MAG TPA: pentapeptide repeat-containing protein, partial [Candidatus Lambdaproteobacteria bacterium]|nr:pentapeptide repeat-containing protein [Candidatus Lambdaproteobacteria bacterium]